jgi:5-(carboxyamino)imidazole ribonucleotide mutase
MPGGVPVATVALDGARNAGILAAQILGAYDENLAKRLDAFKSTLKNKVESMANAVESKGWRNVEK